MRLFASTCVCVSALVASSALAAGPCFDLKDRVVSPRKETLAWTTAGRDVGDSGKDKRFVWARLRGLVKRPIEKVYSFLSDPRRFKDPSVDELTLLPMDPGPFLTHFKVHALVKPFPFVTVEWTDEWAFSLVEGAPARPETILLAYQKVDGTSHIAHYCGTLVLKRVDDETTDVAQYEESNITGKNLDDQVKGLADFLVVLRSRP